MVVARTDIAQTALVRQLQERTVGRRYLAWVWGTPAAQGKIQAMVARDQRDRLKMAVHSIQGKPAITLYRRLANGSFSQAPVALLECRLETGRTHQIRVHLESLGHPLLGDPVYRKRAPNIANDLPLHRQALHAYALSLIHPENNQLIQWYRLPPDDLLALLPSIGMTADDLPGEPKLELPTAT
jgi:23S rRNA pseudouridine1911/1915/1917 synthase